MSESKVARVPNRSIDQPMNGLVKAPALVAATSAPDRSSRLTPRSVETGFRNTLKAKMLIGPGPTIRPSTATKTIFQRKLISLSLLALLSELQHALGILVRELFLVFGRE